MDWATFEQLLASGALTAEYARNNKEALVALAPMLAVLPAEELLTTLIVENVSALEDEVGYTDVAATEMGNETKEEEDVDEEALLAEIERSRARNAKLKAEIAKAKAMTAKMEAKLIKAEDRAKSAEVEAAKAVVRLLEVEAKIANARARAVTQIQISCSHDEWRANVAKCYEKIFPDAKEVDRSGFLREYVVKLVRYEDTESCLDRLLHVSPHNMHIGELVIGDVLAPVKDETLRRIYGECLSQNAPESSRSVPEGSVHRRCVRKLLECITRELGDACAWRLQWHGDSNAAGDRGAYGQLTFMLLADQERNISASATAIVGTAVNISSCEQVILEQGLRHLQDRVKVDGWFADARIPVLALSGDSVRLGLMHMGKQRHEGGGKTMHCVCNGTPWLSLANTTDIDSMRSGLERCILSPHTSSCSDGDGDGSSSSNSTIDSSSYLLGSISSDCASSDDDDGSAESAIADTGGACDASPAPDASPGSPVPEGVALLVCLLATHPDVLCGKRPLRTELRVPDFFWEPIPLGQRIGVGGVADVYEALNWPRTLVEPDLAESVHDSDLAAVAVKIVRKKVKYFDNEGNAIAKLDRAREVQVNLNSNGVRGVPRFLFDGFAKDELEASIDEEVYFAVMTPVGVPLAHYLWEGVLPSASPHSCLDSTFISESHSAAPPVVAERAARVVAQLQQTLAGAVKYGWVNLGVGPEKIVVVSTGRGSGAQVLAAPAPSDINSDDGEQARCDAEAMLTDWGQAQRVGDYFCFDPDFAFCSFAVKVRGEAANAFFPNNVSKRRFAADMDLESLAYSYSAMLHGGRCLRAPWDPVNMSNAGRDRWYDEHPNECPCKKFYQNVTKR